MRRKEILIGGVGGVILILLAVFLFQGRGKKEKEIKLTPTPTLALAPIEEGVEVSLVKKKGGEEVVLTISNIPADINSIEYELSYLTEKRLPRGVLGKIMVSGEREVRREIVLGTCSRNVCVYDKNVKKISLALKFNGEKGVRSYQKDFEW